MVGGLDRLSFCLICLIRLRAHQCHYEQFGDMYGSVTIDGAPYKLSLNVMRDHTHGSNRDWRLMHRYGIQNFKTADGLRCQV